MTLRVLRKDSMRHLLEKRASGLHLAHNLRLAVSGPFVRRVLSKASISKGSVPLDRMAPRSSTSVLAAKELKDLRAWLKSAISRDLGLLEAMVVFMGGAMFGRAVASAARGPRIVVELGANVRGQR